MNGSPNTTGAHVTAEPTELQLLGSSATNVGLASPPGSQHPNNRSAASRFTSEYEQEHDDETDDATHRLLGGDPSAGRTDLHDEPSQGDFPRWLFVKSMLVETAPTLFLTVVGLIFTGELLERVSRWRSLAAIDELFILIPMVNNLKGNLEMNLSARLGTAANIGTLDSRRARQSLVKGNLVLLQLQAIAVSALAATLSFVYGMILPARERMPQEMPQDSPQATRAAVSIVKLLGRGVAEISQDASRKPSKFREFCMTLATAMCSASMSSIILGSFMCSLVLLCRHFRLDPDNIAPPVASCLGDLLTLTLIALSSTTLLYLPFPVLVILLLCLLGVGAWAARSTHRNVHVGELLWDGWTPLLAAMLISSGTGLVLEKYVKKYEGFGMMAVVISGLPGSVGSVAISGLSTALHAGARTHSLKSDRLHPSPSISRSTMPPNHYPLLTAATLFSIALPVQLTFLAFVYGFGWMDLPGTFVGVFVGFFCLVVVLSLTIAHYLTVLMWSYGYDPDNYCLPVHSALMDLIGQLMLVACYELVGQAGVDVDLRRRR